MDPAGERINSNQVDRDDQGGVIPRGEITVCEAAGDGNHRPAISYPALPPGRGR